MRGDDAEAPELTVALADEAATETLGHRIGEHVRAGDLIGLEGELGAGKTTLVRGLHAAMGAGGRVRSPSFATMIEYGGDPPLHHFDLFRYERAGVAFLEEFEEWIFGNGVAVIEWAGRLGAGAPRPHLLVQLAVAGDARTAAVRAVGERWRRFVATLEGGTRLG